MDTKQTIKSQYHAALAMLKGAIDACPDALWLDESYKNRFWHMAYHVLFYTHLYLQEKEADFVPWDKYRENINFFGPPPWAPDQAPDLSKPYTKADILAYLEFCQHEVDKQIPALNLDSENSGFEWLPFGKLELQFYNIRHIQHHAGQLIDRVRVKADIGVDWVGMKREQ